MSRKVSRRIAAMAAIAVFVGCLIGMKWAVPAVAAWNHTAKHAVSVVNHHLKASPISAQQQTTSPVKPSAKTAIAEQAGPKVQTAFYRGDAKPAAMPRVLLSKGDEAACKVKVGDAMPAIELPKLGETSKSKLNDLFGKKATVVVFWKGDRRMSQQQLADTRVDVVEPFGKQGVSVVGVAVDESSQDAEATAKKFGATFPSLHDADGKAFALVGQGRFPRTYVLDPSGKIVWFDIEYSPATRRELRQALRVIAGNK
jgi:peroxiredoxin